MSDTEKTPKQQRGLQPWKPGQSGNPAGRPKGSRNKLGEAFIEALHEDFTANGVAVIEQVRTEKPDQYLKVIASILPKEFHVKDASLEEMSDDELSEILSVLRSFAIGSGARSDRKRAREAAAEGDTVPPRRSH